MIHEKQVRQLCAIHSVNNLLQLPSDLVVDCSDGHAFGRDSEAEEVGDCSNTDDTLPNDEAIVHEWTCHGSVLNHYKQKISCDEPLDKSASTDVPNVDSNSVGGDLNSKKRPKRPWYHATQQEFDDIAKEFTLREQMLMDGDESTFLATTSSQEEAKSSHMTQDRLNKNISMMQRIRSQYGTPYFGNYSLEVLQEALERRGVGLGFYRVPNETKNAPPLEEGSCSENAGSDSSSSNSSKTLIGFIIYKKEENERSILSFLSRIGSHIPIIKHFCGGSGQHWYAITGARYHRHQSPNNASERNHSSNGSKSHWALIDSKMNGIHPLKTDGALMDHLREVQTGRGLVFRACTDTGIVGDGDESRESKVDEDA